MQRLEVLGEEEVVKIVMRGVTKEVMREVMREVMMEVMPSRVADPTDAAT